MKKKDAYSDISRWADRQRESFFAAEHPSDDKKIIDLTSGNPGWVPFSPPLEDIKLNLDRTELLNQYYSTRGTFKLDELITYMASLGIGGERIAPLDSKNFVPGNGVTQLYSATTQSLLTKDDVLLVPVPTYGCFLQAAYLNHTNVRPLPLDPGNGFKLTPELLDKELTRINRELASDSPPKKVTAFLNINPHNPTGAVYGRAEVEALASVLKKHQIRLVIDDMVYAGLEHSQDRDSKDAMAFPFAAARGMFDKTVTLFGLSKAYNLTGLRAAIAVGPKELIGKVREHIGHNSEFVSNMSQLALISTFSPKNDSFRQHYLREQAKHFRENKSLLHMMIEGNNDPANNELIEQIAAETYPKAGTILTKPVMYPGMSDEQMQCYLDERAKAQLLRNEYDTEKELALRGREKLKSQLKNGIPGVKVIPGVESGFFQLIDVTGLKGKYYGGKRLGNAMDICKTLLKDAGVYTLPGETMGYYGDRAILRVSFSPHHEDIFFGPINMANFVEKLRDKPGPVPQIRDEIPGGFAYQDLVLSRDPEQRSK